jgi:anti-sigma factor RsiW
MSRCPNFDDVGAYLDGEYEGDPAEIGRHLRTCAECARTAADIDLINKAVRARETHVRAPATLTAWIDAQRRPVDRRISRRQALGGLALAASVAVGVFVLTRSLDGRQEMKTTLFRDFATLAAADGSLDFVESDPARVLAWFEPRVPFALPRFMEIENIGIRGGRLCWLLERRVAAMHLETRDKGTCLYIADANGLLLDDGISLPAAGSDPVVLSEGGIAGAFWRNSSVALGLVGERSGAQIAELAQRLRATG